MDNTLFTQWGWAKSSSEYTADILKALGLGGASDDVMEEETPVGTTPTENPELDALEEEEQVDKTKRKKALPLPQLPPELEPYRDIVGAIGHIHHPKIESFYPGENFPMGTAFHVGDGIVITAQHTMSWEEEVPGSVTINWGKIAGTDGILTSTVTEILHYPRAIETSLGRMFQGDFAIVRVDNPPPYKIELDASKRLKNRQVTLIGHPANAPLTLSAPGVVHQIDKDRVSYSAENAGGNSGGPVIDVNSHKAVGIHIGSSGQAQALYDPELFPLLQKLGLVD
jgi:hypothetical protein